MTVSAPVSRIGHAVWHSTGYFQKLGCRLWEGFVIHEASVQFAKFAGRPYAVRAPSQGVEKSSPLEQFPQPTSVAFAGCEWSCAALLIKARPMTDAW